MHPINHRRPSQFASNWPRGLCALLATLSSQLQPATTSVRQRVKTALLHNAADHQRTTAKQWASDRRCRTKTPCEFGSQTEGRLEGQLSWSTDTRPKDNAFLRC